MPAARAAAVTAAPSVRMRGDVLGVLHQADTSSRSSSAGPIVVGLVHSFADRPELELVVGRGHEQLLQRVDILVRRVEPPVPLRLGQHDRHALVDRLQQFVRLGRDDRERAQRGASSPIVGIVPDLPQPRERERLTVAAADEPRLLLLLAFELLPLVEAVGRDDARAA